MIENVIKFKKDTIPFFIELKVNNNKDWFEQNRDRWEIIKENYISFMDVLQDKISGIDDILIKNPNKYFSRIHRDLRFSKDKSPFRNKLYSLFERSTLENKPVFYIQVEPGNSFIGFGIWSPDKFTFNKVRSEIAFKSEELFAIIKNDTFKKCFGTVTGESYVRPPQDFNNKSPNMDLIKLKQYMIMKNFSEKRFYPIILLMKS